MPKQVNNKSDHNNFYDLALVNKMCHNKQELVLRLMKVFILQISSSVEELTLASQEIDIEKIRYELHKVGSTLSYCGADVLKNELSNFESLVYGNATRREIETSIHLLNKITQQTVAKMKIDFGI